MFKIISALCLVLAVAKGWGDETEVEVTTRTPHYGFDYKNDYNPENFISLHHRQHENLIKSLDGRLQHLRTKIDANSKELRGYAKIAYEQITQTNKQINPLQFLSEFHKNCVSQYRVTVPTIRQVDAEIKTCHDDFIEKVANLLDAAAKIRNELQNHYETDFHNGIEQCDGTSDFSCIQAVVDQTNRVTVEKQKEFESEIEAAECIFEAGMKRSVDCAYNVASDTTEKTVTAIYSINNCITPNNDCKPCDLECNEITERVHSEEVVIGNPFHNNHAECVLFTNYSA